MRCLGFGSSSKRKRSHRNPKVTSDSAEMCSIRYKPSSVPHRSAVFVISLRLQFPATSSNLPLDIGRAALHTSIYLVLHLVGCTARECRHLRGGLLPHLFTLTVPCGGRRLFSVTLCHALANIFPLESTMLCGARTFLLSAEPTGDKPRLLQCGHKGNTFFVNYQKNALYHSVAMM